MGNPSSSIPANNECISGLRLSEKEEAEIIQALSQKTATPSGRERRKQDRVPYQHRAGLVVKVQHPGGTVSNYLVRVRNLSTGGIGFLHGSFLHNETRCTVALRTKDNRTSCVEGSVVRCEHVRRHIHEVGLRFDKAINVGDFVASAFPTSRVAHSRELPQLTGKVLYVEDSVNDQQLLNFHLENVGVKVQAVCDVLGAVDLIEQQKFDAVLTNLWLPMLSGLELTDFLRQHGYQGPIIVLSVDDRKEVAQEALKRGCTSVLRKPYHFEDLFAALEPHLRVKPKSALVSEMWADERMRPLILSFLARLQRDMAEMKTLAKTGNAGVRLQKVCFEVKGSAGSYGYPQISAAAKRILDQVLAGAVNDQLLAEIDALAEQAQSACSILENQAA